MNLPVQEEEAGRLKRQGAEQAISLALESKWEEAAGLNRAILAVKPNDGHAWTRTGKGRRALGRFRDAHGAYAKALHLDPVNSIAKRNMERLASLQDAEEPRREAAKVAQDLFIEVTGKSGTTTLAGVAPTLLAKTAAGDEVYLKADGDGLKVENVQGEILGAVEAKLGLRLLRMIEGGNRYAAAVKSAGERDLQLIIKETYRDPSQTKLSFPAVGSEAVRPYTKDSLLRYEDDEEEEEEESEDEAESDEWDGESESQSGNLSLSTFKESRGDREDEEDEQ